MEKSETGSVNHYHYTTFNGPIQSLGSVGGTNNTSQIGNTFLCQKKCLDSTLDSSEQTQPVATGGLGYLSSFLPNNPFSETLKKVVDIFDEVR